MRSHGFQTRHCAATSPTIHTRTDMKLLLPVCLASLWSICSAAGDWCYPSQFTCSHPCNVPEKWDHANRDCAGKKQSPINIVTKNTLKDDSLKPFKFENYQQIFRSSIKNNGHSVQVDIPHLSTISGGGLSTSYKAVQLHLHWGHNGGPGSEHTLDGEQFPMELHIVHMKSRYSDLTTALRDREGIAVLGFFYEKSNTANRKYDPIISALRNIKTTNVNTTIPPISLVQLILSEQNMTSYYRYNGSLTTPGCAESVVWTVFENPIPLSEDQLAAFSEVQFNDGKQMKGNFRPVQPLNGRQVFRSGSTKIMSSFALLLVIVAMAMGLSTPN